MRLQEERLKISSDMFVENFQDIAHLSRICMWNQKKSEKGSHVYWKRGCGKYFELG